MADIPIAKRILLNVRYSFGYLAAGFLISAPLQLFGHTGATRDIFISLVYGGACGLVFLALLPLSDIDWTSMRLPEFKRFELSVTRNTWIGSVAVLVLSWFHSLPGLDVNTAWIVFVLSAFAYIKIKGHSLIFHEFYKAGLEGEAPRLPEEIEAEVRKKLAAKEEAEDEKTTGGAVSTPRQERGEKEGS